MAKETHGRTHWLEVLLVHDCRSLRFFANQQERLQLTWTCRHHQSNILFEQRVETRGLSHEPQRRRGLRHYPHLHNKLRQSARQTLHERLLVWDRLPAARKVLTVIPVSRP